LLGAGDFQALFAEDLFLSSKEVRKGRWGGGIRREQPGNDAFALGDVDFLAVAEQVFHSGESITKIADASFLHVMHFSIICCAMWEKLNLRGDAGDTGNHP